MKIKIDWKKKEELDQGGGAVQTVAVHFQNVDLELVLLGMLIMLVLGYVLRKLYLDVRYYSVELREILKRTLTPKPQATAARPMCGALLIEGHPAQERAKRAPSRRNK